MSVFGEKSNKLGDFNGTGKTIPFEIMLKLDDNRFESGEQMVH